MGKYAYKHESERKKEGRKQRKAGVSALYTVDFEAKLCC